MNNLTKFGVRDLTSSLFSKVQLDEVAREIEGNMTMHICVAKNRVKLVYFIDDKRRAALEQEDRRRRRVVREDTKSNN